MKIKPFTPAIRMQRSAIMNRSFDWLEDVGVEYGVSKNEVWAALRDFGDLSLRVNGQAKTLDFELLQSTDDSEMIKTKLIAYLNTDNPDAVWKIENAILAFDAPSNPDTAPEAPSDPEA
jgi:hypothetical protein